MKVTEQELRAKREAVRDALNRYGLALAMASEDASQPEREHYRKCETQVESAKRVLWMGN
jgi:hypothetical protein